MFFESVKIGFYFIVLSNLNGMESFYKQTHTFTPAYLFSKFELIRIWKEWDLDITRGGELRKLLSLIWKYFNHFFSKNARTRTPEVLFPWGPLQPHPLLCQRTLGLVVMTWETRNDPKEKGGERWDPLSYWGWEPGLREMAHFSTGGRTHHREAKLSERHVLRSTDRNWIQS